MKKTVLFAAVAAVLIAGCGSKKQASSAAHSGSYMTMNNDSYNGYAVTEEAYYVEDVEPSEEAPLAEKEEAEIDPVQTQEKLVYTGRLSIQTLHYDETVKDIKAKINSYKGIIEFENEYDNGYNWYYDEEYSSTMHLSFKVRIPTEHYQDFMNDLEGSEKVLSRESSVENITRRYNDTEAQIEALQIQEKRLLDMMEKAETIEDMIAVESRLTEVQMDLNSLKTDREAMDTDVKYSTVYVEVDEVRKYTVHNENFVTRFLNSFADGWTSFTENIGDFTIAIAHAWPYLIMLAGIVIFCRKKDIHPLAKAASFLKGIFHRKGRKNPENDSQNS